MSENKTEVKKSVHAYDGKEFVDELGRKITLRKPNIMDKYYLKRALGKDAENSGCLEMMAAIIYVAKIDDYVVQTPVTYEDCKALLGKLREEGVECVWENLVASTQNTEVMENVKK